MSLNIGSLYPPSGNLMASAKSFGNRGGFVNGLNPWIAGPIYYVSGNANSLWGPIGDDGNNGLSPLTPLASMSRAFALILNAQTLVEQPNAIVVLIGTIREQVVGCKVKNVTIIGAGLNPYQGTDSGADNGAGGASWLAPTSPAATTPLIRVVEQGWSFFNIQFAPVAASACITFDRRETAAIPDSSHGLVQGCYFSTGGSGGFGVEIIETKKTFIKYCTFEALTGAGGLGIKTTAGSGIANPSYCEIVGNKFAQNTGDMDLTGMDRGLITDNNLFTSNVILAGTRIKLNGGNGFNHVLNNNFSDVAADVTIAKGYTPGTSDVWRNWTTNTNVPIVTVPA